MISKQANKPALQTLAESMAAQADNDGQRWETLTGRDFVRLLECRAQYVRAQHGYGTEPRRYVFADDSVIIVTANCWDLGLSPGCYCMQGAEHGRHYCQENDPAELLDSCPQCDADTILRYDDHGNRDAYAYCQDCQTAYGRGDTRVMLK